VVRVDLHPACRAEVVGLVPDPHGWRGELVQAIAQGVDAADLDGSVLHRPAGGHDAVVQAVLREGLGGLVHQEVAVTQEPCRLSPGGRALGDEARDDGLAATRGEYSQDVLVSLPDRSAHVSDELLLIGSQDHFTAPLIRSILAWAEAHSG
jgi:hypothetical protein